MAEVDFGDRELFEQLDDSAPSVNTHLRFTYDDEENSELGLLRSRLEESEDHIQKLTEENKGLRRNLNVLMRPSGVTVEDINMDGPALQILYANNMITKKCRQEIEDAICSIMEKHQKPNGQKKNPYFLKAQPSAFALEEDPEMSNSCSVKTTSESFKIIGSVQYFTTFSVDKLGQPLLNENPQMTDGWEVPVYQQVFNQVIGTDGQEIEMKEKRPKSMCFNCGSGGHQLRDCPKPKDMAAINERRKEFTQSNQAMQNNQRYHADEVEERFSKYKPGVMSDELLSALGIDNCTLPPLIYRMRQLGYPPGWLKEAEMENSGLALYDGKAPNDGSGDDSNKVSYDVSKLVDYPGFNVAVPHKIKDEYMQYGSVPMQPNHMKQNYAAYLSTSFPSPGASSNKRRHESESSPQKRKKNRSSPDRSSNRSSDMEIESDPGTPYNNSGSGDFQFQAPPPPGSPCFSTPPPLPQGTPPATPTPPPLPKGTPPPTPNNGSPALRGRSWAAGDEEGTADELSLEELEEQQRLIWAALENADTATNSDCETPAIGTPAASSPSVSSSAPVDAELDEVEDASQNGETERQEVVTESPGPIRSQEDTPKSPEPVKFQEYTGIKLIKTQDENPDSPLNIVDDSPLSPEAEADDLDRSMAIPHRKNFAAGIVPFEETPEYTEVAEAKGTYLKIRDLLKSSPRSLSKKK